MVHNSVRVQVKLTLSFAKLTALKEKRLHFQRSTLPIVYWWMNFTLLRAEAPR